MKQYIDTAQDISGNALPLATCKVLNYPSGTNASIFSDNGLTPIGLSTVSADLTGQFSFFVADGDYTLQLFNNGTLYKTQSPVSIFDGAPQVTFQDTGGANAYAVANSALEKALRAGLRASFLAANNNTGASTFQYNTLAVKPIVLPGGGALPAGAILANGIYGIEYDGTSWQIKNYLLNGATIGGALYPQTSAELAAGVTPTNFQYPPYQVQRYMSASQLADYLAGTMAVDQTSAFTTAETVAYVGAVGKIYAPSGQYLFQGTLTIRSGVILYGDGAGNSEYFPGATFNTVQVTLLRKSSAGTAGPMFILQTGDALRGLYLKFELLAGSQTGVIQIGTATHVTPFVDGTFNLDLHDISLYGPAIAGASLVDNTCTAIYFFDGNVNNGVQRYNNRFSNVRIQNFFNGWRLGENCNGNVFTGIAMRQCYNFWVLNGGSNASCIENVVAGLSMINIGVLPTSTPICFTLSNGAINNVFTGYSTECLGTAFSFDLSSSAGNVFLGYENEANLSVVPPGNFHALWAQPNNRSQSSQMILPATATPQNYTNGTGNLVRQVQNISGTLPQLNGSGTLVAADVNSKVFARFNSTVYVKSAAPTFRCKLSVYLNAPGGGVGMGVVEVEFWVRPTDNVTHAGSVSVISVNKKPASNYVAGLKFLTGVAAGLGYGLAVVGGNVGAVTANQFSVDLEIFACTFTTNVVAMNLYNSITWGTAAATANDVTDAVDLLTVADTAF